MSLSIDTILGLFFSSSPKNLTFLTFVQGSCRGFALLRDLERFFVRPKRRVAAKDENHQRQKGKDATVSAFEVFVVNFDILDYHSSFNSIQLDYKNIIEICHILT